MKPIKLFYGYKSPFSNHYKCNFEIHDIKFTSSEQAFMYYKAVMFGDGEIAQKILKEHYPPSVKQLGRQVKNFNQRVWEEECIRIMYKINVYKFTQNPDLLEELLRTDGMILAEASPRDLKWGIGMGKDNPKALIQSEWRGKNLLGQTLMLLRNKLIKSGYKASGADDKPPWD